MRKVIFILLLFAVFGLEKAIAQRGLNNNSDIRVPVPGNISTAARIIRVIVPSQPVIFAIPGVPLISPINTLPSGGLMPTVPIRPNIPVGPNPSQFNLSSVSTTPSTAITGMLPSLPILPPVSPIPPMPEIRLPRLN